MRLIKVMNYPERCPISGLKIYVFGESFLRFGPLASGGIYLVEVPQSKYHQRHSIFGAV